MHRQRALKDEDFVPEDTVDQGEQETADDVLADEPLDLSYLWVVDTRALRPPSPSFNSTKSNVEVDTKKIKKSLNKTTHDKVKSQSAVLVTFPSCLLC